MAGRTSASRKVRVRSGNIVPARTVGFRSRSIGRGRVRIPMGEGGSFARTDRGRGALAGAPSDGPGASDVWTGVGDLPGWSMTFGPASGSGRDRSSQAPAQGAGHHQSHGAHAKARPRTRKRGSFHTGKIPRGRWASEGAARSGKGPPRQGPPRVGRSFARGALRHGPRIAAVPGPRVRPFAARTGVGRMPGARPGRPAMSMCRQKTPDRGARRRSGKTSRKATTVRTQRPAKKATPRPTATKPPAQDPRSGMAARPRVAGHARARWRPPGLRLPRGFRRPG
ncbi:hypothetical protein SAMN05878426_104151 [Phaeovulum vinaykumarii]|uniref:Uncharacterized protein n=1 Tax=Phaeovulum vinaykumarii TaxID=407234 RepID=A0A1N7LTM5_9RHOB|nr:hypothetical protein SAMN05421795_104103 [Phaeovulum vinaykumarii]SOC07538.1 hypothetical protein SAMN05878426_104151 [Phaeovulum vinaykumarii]